LGPLAVLAAIVLSQPMAAAAPTQEVRRILILNEANPSYPAIPIINQGIQTALNDSPYHVEIYSEYFDTLLFPDPAVQQEFRDFYIRKYQNRKPDVIITVGPSPLRFMQEVHQRAFPGVPIVFCLPYGSAPGAPLPNSDFTGVENDMAPGKTIEIALRLQPATRNIVVVGGVSTFDQKGQATVKEELKPYEGRLDISYLTDLALPDLLERLEHLPNHTLVLLTTVGQDAAGHSFKSNEIGPLVAGAANAPVFSLFDVYLNHGEVGGYLSSLSEQGKVAGSMALRLLKGEKPQDIATVRNLETYMFDWRALRRWGLKESALPPGSILINRQPTAWDSYKPYVIGGTSLIILQGLLIGGLVWQRTRRRKAEAAVHESEQRFRLVANSAPVLIWMSGPDKLCTYFNQPWLDFTGQPLQAELGNGWARGVHSEDLKISMDTYTEAFDRLAQFQRQYRLRRNDGEYRWVLDTGVPRFNRDSSFAGYIGSCIDITERKMAENAVASLSGRLIEAQDEERKRIAREVHDDYSQRVALLGVELEQLAEIGGASSAEASQKVHELLSIVGGLASDLHALSHRLHSSTLESLGLVAGLKAFCVEFSDQQDIEVDFASENLPLGIPGDATLCIFRITQEALRNVKKHSGANRAVVRLEWTGDRLHLSVSDLGKGFDSNKPSAERGIGIRSMEERLRLLGGQLEIQSLLMEGTRIDAWLSLKMTRAA
jgi:PAS domain S-box-containing protein